MANEEDEITGFSDMDFVESSVETPKEEIDIYVDHLDFPRFLFGKHWHDPDALREFLYTKNGIAKKRGPGRPKGGDSLDGEA